MWCLETIIALNEAAAKRAQKGEPTHLAYKDVGINTIRQTHEPQKPKERKLKVV